VRGTGCSWSEGKQYCAALKLAGAQWRLPTKSELESLVDDRTSQPASTFPGAGGQGFWTSSPFAESNGGVGGAWTVDFFNGETGMSAIVNGWGVRCVH
jgi:hypothetical protein